MSKILAFQYSGDDEDGEWWARPRRAYKSFGPFRVVSTLMVAVCVGCIAFGLACAVMFLADVAEEHPSRARWALRALIIFNVTVHVSILLIDHLSWWRSALSLVVNALYWRLMKTFPFIPNANSPIIITSVALVFLESMMWYWYSVQLMYYTSVLNIIGFFLMLWMVPIGLVTSCVVEDDRLPGAEGVYGNAGSGAGGTAGGRGRHKRTILNSLTDLMK